MKKVILTTAMIGLLGTSVFALGGHKNAVRSSYVSYSLENQFDSDFNGAKDVIWTVTPDFQKATFTLNNEVMTAFYSPENDYLGVSTDVSYSEVSNKAQAQIADKYKDYTVKEVIKLETPDANNDFETTEYFVDLKNADKELLVKVTPSNGISFYKEVK